MAARRAVRRPRRDRLGRPAGRGRDDVRRRAGARPRRARALACREERRPLRADTPARCEKLRARRGSAYKSPAAARVRQPCSTSWRPDERRGGGLFTFPTRSRPTCSSATAKARSALAPGRELTRRRMRQHPRARSADARPSASATRNESPAEARPRSRSRRSHTKTNASDRKGSRGNLGSPALKRQPRARAGSRAARPRCPRTRRRRPGRTGPPPAGGSPRVRRST